jgi:hypothetical protein
MDDSAKTVCSYCLAAVGEQEPAVSCPACHTVYHQECWAENGGCGVYGCTEVPAVESRRAIEVPVSYWGQENKPCPACRQEILAAALRCRHCGATFVSARPEDAVEFQARAAINASLDKTRQTVTWIFILSVVPFLAPIGAAWGAIWLRANRDSVRALPALYGALARIGLIVSIALTITIVALTGLYIGVRGH